MRLRPITAREFSDRHPFEKRYSTDGYYIKVANKLLKVYERFTLKSIDCSDNILRDVALTLACYMEDVVADSGQWRAFANRSRSLYGKDVPLFVDDAFDYYDDEPSFVAVWFLVWHTITEHCDKYIYPTFQLITTLALAGFRILDGEFENAPVNDDLKNDIKHLIERTMIDDSMQSFDRFRDTLMWLTSYSYLFSCARMGEIFDELFESATDLDMLKDDLPLAAYFARVNSVINYKTGALALYPREYLADLALAFSLTEAAERFNAVEVAPMGMYRIHKTHNPALVEVEHTSGKRYLLERSEFTIDDNELYRDGSTIIMTFVKYGTLWHINGVIAPTVIPQDKWEKACSDDRSNPNNKVRDVTPDFYIDKMGGKQIVFLENTDALKRFYTDTLGVPESSLHGEEFKNHGNKPVVVFIDKDAAKYAMHTCYGAPLHIRADDNPYYDPDGDTGDVENFIFDSNVSTAMLHYLVGHDMLPGLRKSRLLELARTERDFQGDVDFLARYVRKDKY